MTERKRSKHKQTVALLATTGKTTFVKYSNRKLYSLTDSRYVNVADVGKLPTGSFVVLDNKTKTDITSEIVLSAITEYFKNNPASFESVRENLVNQFLT